MILHYYSKFMFKKIYTHLIHIKNVTCMIKALYMKEEMKPTYKQTLILRREFQIVYLNIVTIAHAHIDRYSLRELHNAQIIYFFFVFCYVWVVENLREYFIIAMRVGISVFHYFIYFLYIIMFQFKSVGIKNSRYRVKVQVSTKYSFFFF